MTASNRKVKSKYKGHTVVRASHGEEFGGAIADGSITASKIAPGAIINTTVANNSIDSNNYVNGSIDGVHIADDSIDSNHYIDGSIDGVHIADNSIGTNHLGVDVIVAEDIANNAITVAELANNAVTAAKISSNDPQFCVDAAGNVGIGTTNPGAKLDISGSFKLNNTGGGTLYPTSNDVYKNGSTASLKHSNILNTAGWRNASVIESITGTAPSGASTEGLYLNATYGSSVFTSASVHVDCNTGNGDISFLTGTGAAAPTTKFKLQNNGNVGIGTTAPLSPLHVVGDARLNGNLVVGPDLRGSIAEKAEGFTGSAVAVGGTVDLVVAGASSFQGFLTVSSVHPGDASKRTQATFSVFGRGPDFTASVITSIDGTGSMPFSLTSPTNGIIRFTNDNATLAAAVTMVYFGSAGF